MFTKSERQLNYWILKLCYNKHNIAQYLPLVNKYVIAFHISSKKLFFVLKMLLCFTPSYAFFVKKIYFTRNNIHVNKVYSKKANSETTPDIIHN